MADALIGLFSKLVQEEAGLKIVVPALAVDAVGGPNEYLGALTSSIRIVLNAWLDCFLCSWMGTMSICRANGTIRL